MSLYLPLHKNLHRQYAFEHIPSKVTSESLHLDPKKKIDAKTGCCISFVDVYAFIQSPTIHCDVCSFVFVHGEIKGGRSSHVLCYRLLLSLNPTKVRPSSTKKGTSRLGLAGTKILSRLSSNKQTVVDCY
jgi:hypothetical protein